MVFRVKNCHEDQKNIILQHNKQKMSSTKVQRPVKVDNPEDRLVQKERHRKDLHRRATFNSANGVPKKHKHENDGRKFGRKRVAPGCPKFFPPYKRRKKEEQLTLPTKFLLGGNIYDPLNLNSLQDEEINREMNAFTPKSSPLPTPKHRKGAIEVIIPPNLHDPLNLASCDNDEEYEQQLISPIKKNSRKPRTNRGKKKRNSSSGCSSKENSVNEVSLMETTDVFVSPEVAPPTESSETIVTNVESATGTEKKVEAVASRNLELPLKKEQPKDKSKFRKFDSKDKIVSPVIPQSRCWTRPYSHRPGMKQHKKADEHKPTFNPKNTRYQYGNYTRYYGYRNPNHEDDIRLKSMAERKGLFYDKDVLDIGCNVGHVSLSVARDFAARSVVGLDIDRSLIAIARKNIRNYVNCKDSPVNNSDRPTPGPSKNKFFPISMPIVYGPVDLPGISESPSARKKFPENVSFVQGNYVLDSDMLLETEQAQFDVILCLSISKWLHLNWGDAGLKQAFRRMFIQLRPGGKLILEAQSWDSYKKRKTLTETIYKNFVSIKLFPQKFTQYLLNEVGFAKCEVLATPMHQSKGFQRPIQMFTKGAFSSSYSATSDSNTPFYASTCGRSKAPVYTSVVVSTRDPDDDEAFNDRNIMECENSEYLGNIDEDSQVVTDGDSPAFDRFPKPSSVVKDEPNEASSNVDDETSSDIPTNIKVETVELVDSSNDVVVSETCADSLIGQADRNVTLVKSESPVTVQAEY